MGNKLSRAKILVWGGIEMQDLGKGMSILHVQYRKQQPKQVREGYVTLLVWWHPYLSVNSIHVLSRCSRQPELQGEQTFSGGGRIGFPQ